MIMLLCGVLAGALVAAADIWLLLRPKKIASAVHAVIRDMIFVNLLSIGIGKYIFAVPDFLSPRLHSQWFPLKYFVLTLAVGLLLLLAKGIIEGAFVFETVPPKKKGGAWALRIISTFFTLIGAAAATGTVWGKKTFGDMTPDQMLINLNSPIEGTSSEVYETLFKGPVVETAIITAIFCVFAFSNRRLVYRRADDRKQLLFPGLARRIIALLMSLCILSGGLAFGIKEFQLFELYNAYVNATTYIEDNYHDPRTTEMHFPEQKRNLIHIYLESVENTFASKAVGGNMKDNLIPELTELSKEGYSFSHLPEGLGGPLPSTGAGWSVASMVNMGTGLPMKVPVNGNSYGAPNNFLPGAYTIGDILKDNGYEQTLMFGADAAFGGLNFFFGSHGDFNILDYYGVIDKGWLDPNYKVWWGYEDDKLFEFAKTELTRLSETGKPFHFVMETADTHFPDGYVEPGMENKYDIQYANVIAYSSKQVVEFVRWIQAQPFYDNTTIVLIGDHETMDSSLIDTMDSGYQRTTYNLILNPAPNVRDIPEEYMHNRKWARFDMFPTLLASIGVEIEGERLGIGTNMFSGEPTLFERDGVAETNSSLSERSNFYNENILTKKDK